MDWNRREFGRAMLGAIGAAASGFGAPAAPPNILPLRGGSEDERRSPEVSCPGREVVRGSTRVPARGATTLAWTPTMLSCTDAGDFPKLPELDHFPRCGPNDQ